MSTAIYYVLYLIYRVKKGKAIPVTGLWGPEGSGRLRLQITRLSAHEGGKVVTPTHRPPLPPGISWYSFLEAESTPGHMDLSDASENIPSDTTGDRSRDLPTSSAAP